MVLWAIGARCLICAGIGEGMPEPRISRPLPHSPPLNPHHGKYAIGVPVVDDPAGTIPRAQGDEQGEEVLRRGVVAQRMRGACGVVQKLSGAAVLDRVLQPLRELPRVGNRWRIQLLPEKIPQVVGCRAAGQDQHAVLSQRTQGPAPQV